MLKQDHKSIRAHDGAPSIQEKAQGTSDNENIIDGRHVEASGYVSELHKNRSTAQVAFMTSVLSSIPMAISVSLYFSILNGGPANMLWGFIAVSLIICCQAVSLGEITSVYPTAGGVYYQTFMLSSGRWRKLTAWICGWSYVIGNVLIALSVNFSTVLFLVDSLNIFGSATGVAIYEAKTYQVFLMFLALTAFCVAVSSLGNKWLPWIDVGLALFLALAYDIALILV